MSLISLLSFYSNLSSDGEFFFWIIIFLFVILLVLAVLLINKNRKLSKLIEEKLDLDYDDFSKHNDETSKKDEDSLNDKNNEEVNQLKEDNKENTIKEEVRENLNVEIKKDEQNEKKDSAYKKNVLREMSPKMPFSPIGYVKEKELKQDKVKVEVVSNTKKELEEFDLDGIDYGEGSVSPLVDMEDIYEENDNMKFASEIVEKMEEEIKPSNIELTDYEKKQEEEAIISYDELQKVKDKIYNIDENEETDEFIDELKSFRIDLH